MYIQREGERAAHPWPSLPLGGFCVPPGAGLLLGEGWRELSGELIAVMWRRALLYS